MIRIIMIPSGSWRFLPEETHDEDGNPVWNCKCSIKEKDTVTNGRSSSKKDAKKQAAYDMLTFVLEEE